ncbi:MAG: transporter [Flavobacteriaceae bacterium]|nr:transporter [Flavobacteriaceae bacterium]
MKTFSKKKIISLLLLITSIQFVNAQYTEIINSKRPGFSESPYGVGTDVIQIEGGIFFGKSNSNETFAKTDPFGGTIFIRYGKFMEKLEFNAKVTYQKNKLTFNNVFSTDIGKVSGLSELTLGAKYLIFQQKFTDNSKEIRSWKKRTAFDKKRLIPSVGVYVGMNLNFLGKAYKEKKMSPKAAVLLQNDFTNRFVLLTNLIADKVGTDNRTYSYIVTATYAINQDWSFFAENQGDFLKYKTDFQIGTGAAYLWNENLQFDAAVRANLSVQDSNFIVSLGATWRLDRHKDEVIETDKDGNKIKQKKTKKNGFFSRLFKKKKKK